MDIGFIGAGKVGISLGKYLKENGLCITGYYSRNPVSAKEAAEYTGSKDFQSVSKLADECEVLFLSVPDGQIAKVWEEIKPLPVAGKIICHCSGALSSAVFSEISQKGAFGYSIHPLLAVSDKFQSYQTFSKALFTVEGSRERLEAAAGLLRQCGNPVEIIDAAAKMKYHAAAVMASNLVNALAYGAERLLAECGFSAEHAREALKPLFLGNAAAVAEKGPMEALTGPVERGDVRTVEAHLEALEGRNLEIYHQLSLYALELAEQKHPDRDYGGLAGMLTNGKEGLG